MSFNNFQARKTKVADNLTVVVEVYQNKGPQCALYVIVNLMCCGADGSWKNQPRVTINRDEFEWFLRDPSPPVGRFNRVESSSHKNGGVTLTRLDVWNDSKLDERARRSVTIPKATYEALHAFKSGILGDILAAEKHVSALNQNRLDIDKKLLQHIVASWLVRVNLVNNRRSCMACTELVEVGNQLAHTCMMMGGASPDEYREILDNVTINHIAAVLASNGVNRPTITMEEIIGDSKDIITVAVQGGILPAATQFLDVHTSLHADLFKTVPELSTWNSS